MRSGASSSSTCPHAASIACRAELTARHGDPRAVRPLLGSTSDCSRSSQVAMAGQPGIPGDQQRVQDGQQLAGPGDVRRNGRQRGAAAVVVVPGELELQRVLQHFVGAEADVDQGISSEGQASQQRAHVRREPVGIRRQFAPRTARATARTPAGRTRSTSGWSPRARRPARRSRCRSYRRCHTPPPASRTSDGRSASRGAPRSRSPRRRSPSSAPVWLASLFSPACT